MSVHKDGRSSCGTQQYWRARPAKGGPSKGKFPSHEAGAAWLAVGRGRTAATALGQLTWSANQPSLAGWSEAAPVGCPSRALGRNTSSRRSWAPGRASAPSASRQLRCLEPQRPTARPAREKRAKEPERALRAEPMMQFRRRARGLAWQRRGWPRPGSWRSSRPRGLPAPPRRSLQRELKLLLRAVRRRGPLPHRLLPAFL